MDINKIQSDSQRKYQNARGASWRDRQQTVNSNSQDGGAHFGRISEDTVDGAAAGEHRPLSQWRGRGSSTSWSGASTAIPNRFAGCPTLSNLNLHQQSLQFLEYSRCIIWIKPWEKCVHFVCEYIGHKEIVVDILISSPSDEAIRQVAKFEK